MAESKDTALAAEWVTDPEMLSAVLDIHRSIELREQLQILLGRVVEWCGGQGGLALGPGEEEKAWTPLASTYGDPPAWLARLAEVEPGRIRAWLGDGTKTPEGPGPLSGLGPDASGPSVAFAVCGTEGVPVGVLLVLGPQRTERRGVVRATNLIEATRPAVANALRVHAIRELVIKDDTAQCFNRRYFESCLPEELARASRFHAALSLIFLDMDNLKQVNNRHGHAMGSRTLLEVSRRVRQKIRRFDKLFRFGGDEFCIVLPETEWHGALEVAERVRDAIASQPFLVRELKDPVGQRMTASLGIASFPLHARTHAELVVHADRAMQQVKRGTKNSIGVAEILGEANGA